MDFTLVGFDHFSSSTNHAAAGYGSGFLKQERPFINIENDDFRDFKVAKNDSLLKNPLQREVPQQMLCFSSPNSFPYYSSPAFSRNTAMSRGPFTPSQWIELEHQALIYKYILANVPVPSYLLNPIRKAFESAGFSSFHGLRSSALGWGGFHLGFSNTDPEPGRCRRTDGKKWRCSRDAVADQKYCERHMNRGRHRSRKPVEGQSGQPASGTAASNAKPPPASSSSASVVPAGGGVSSVAHHHQLGNHLSGIPNINRSSVLDKEDTDRGSYQRTTLESPKMCPKSNYLIPKPYEEASRTTEEFGLVCSDSLLNPLNRSSSLVMNCRNYGETTSENQQHKSHNHHPLRQFMDDWPKNNKSTISWPHDTTTTTQLSISIPTPTPTNDQKLRSSSPLRLSREQLEMGLGVGTNTNASQLSWEPSMGGPLGEVLHTTGDNMKPLNLIDSWDHSRGLASSPTGVLQRGAFGSLSNSSAGSSPRADGVVIGSSVMNHSSFPAL